jgi:uncharacterized damage-inducible protein DinB
MPDKDHAVRKQLLEFLRGGHAHATLEDAVKDFPSRLYTQKPEGAPHNAWQLLEHIRFTLHDLLEFSTNPEYQTPQWPGDYWPEDESPRTPDAWKHSVDALRMDLRGLEKLLQDSKTDLYAKIPWGKDQSILREILLAIDHTSYHTGQLIMLRKQMDAWKN